MFTGLVQEIGTILEIWDQGGVTLVVQSPGGITYEGVELGDSIAINGVCLTVTQLFPETRSFAFDCAPETMRRTNLGDLVVGSPCNVERSLKYGDAIGGHFVQGHVDCTGTIQSITKENESLWFRIQLQDRKDLMQFIVNKGYIALDGTSLTVCDVDDDTFTFMLIPFTQEHIILPRKSIGDRVNLEVDMVAKYVHKMTGSTTPVSLEGLQRKLK